ncbi:MAG TPA: low affinity iron permease family protein [Phycisphaerae bacterium]|nr:low affinity iron permease family protein [Phycisphaerae bacterium]
MNRKKRNTEPRFSGGLEKISGAAAAWTGRSTAFLRALLTVVVWIATGSLFAYSDSWQLVINTGTTIITFLMVFLIQRSQNKDSLAVHLKLNEIVAVLQGASNRLVDVESLSENELNVLHQHFHELARMADREQDVGKSHSIEEAEARHKRKAGE